MKPFRQLLMPRARGLAGPFFHPWALGSRLIHGTGNFIGGTGGGSQLPSADDIAPGVWVDKGFWLSGTAYALNDVVEHQGRYFINHTGGTASAANEPGVGATWEDSWHEISAVGLSVPYEAVIATPSDGYEIRFKTNTNSVANAGEYEGTVDFGDGTIAFLGFTGPSYVLHTYASAGEHTIRFRARQKTTGVSQSGFLGENGTRQYVKRLNSFGFLADNPAPYYARLGYCCSYWTGLESGAYVPKHQDATSVFQSTRFNFAGVDLSATTTLNNAYRVVAGSDFSSAAANVIPTTSALTSLFYAFTSALGTRLDEFIVAAFVDLSGVTNATGAFQSAVISQSTVDTILARFVAGGKSNVTLGINVANGVEPSAAGWANIATLESRGWTVTYNGTPP